MVVAAASVVVAYHQIDGTEALAETLARRVRPDGHHPSANEAPHEPRLRGDGHLRLRHPNR